MESRSRTVTIISLYFILVGGLTIFNGLSIFIAGAVTVAVSSAPLITSNAPADPPPAGGNDMLALAVLGAALLIAGTVVIANAIALFGRRPGSRISSVWVAVLTLIVALICLFIGIKEQVFVLALSPIVIYLFTLNRPMQRYFARR